MIYTADSLDGVRLPSSLVLALLPTAALFWCLWSLTHVQFEMPTIRTYIIDYGPGIVDTPIKSKREPERVIVPPPVTPVMPRLPVPGEIGETIIVDTRPLVAPPDAGIPRGSIPVGPNSELMPLVRVNPDYPPRAITLGLEGWVKVQFTVTATGAVKDAAVIDSSASIFEAAALKAIVRWRYRPMVIDGIGVERVGVQTVLRFKLEN